jgi:trans-2,3-dihydro-3-hydroxyanthranilate isomerase
VLHYQVVDVFTTEPLAGNPLAVFTDGSELDDGTMQRIAAEMNLAETTFILPPEDSSCLARVRIFTPRKEMDFAGHPTIGTAFVIHSQASPTAGRSFFLQERVGPVGVVVENGRRPTLWLRTPPISEGKIYDRELCARALSLRSQDLLEIEPQLLTAGNPTLLISLKDKAAVDRAWLDASGMKTLRADAPQPFCVFVFCPTEKGAYSRMFAPDYGIPEDPATGSSTGPLAAYMMKHGLVQSGTGTRFVSEQGVKMGRRSLVYVRMEDNRERAAIYIGGHVTPVADGTMRL